MAYDELGPQEFQQGLSLLSEDVDSAAKLRAKFERTQRHIAERAYEARLRLNEASTRRRDRKISKMCRPRNIACMIIAMYTAIATWPATIITATQASTFGGPHSHSLERRV